MLIVTIHNLSGIKPKVDYQYEVRVNSTVIADGVIRGRRRNSPWRTLLQHLIDKEVMKEDYNERVKREAASDELATLTEEMAYGTQRSGQDAREGGEPEAAGD